MTNPVTRHGYDKLMEELSYLSKTMRLVIAKEIEAARGFGDISENAEYQCAKERQGLNELKIEKLQNFLSDASIVEPPRSQPDRVVFGVPIKMRNLDTDEERVLTIVGETESDVRAGKISYKSPMGKEMIGKSPGEDIEIETPRGEQYWEVLEIQF